MLDSIHEYVKTHYPTHMAKIGGLVCAAAAIEMAILIPSNISQIHHVAGDALDPLKYALSANLGGAIFYGLCALNIVPKTAAIGSGIFTFYSLIHFQSEGTYYTSLAMGKGAEFVTQKMILPLCEHALFPAIRKLAEMAKKLIEMIGTFVIKMPLPQHPAWIGVIVLGAAVVVYQFVLPYFQKATTTSV